MGQTSRDLKRLKTAEESFCGGEGGGGESQVARREVGGKGPRVAVKVVQVKWGSWD